MQPLLNIAVSAARQAGELITRHLEQLDRIKITPKGNAGFYSEVDIKAEQIIINTIHKAYPDHGIIAEESGSHNDSSECVWIIDPLDGTNNFIHGFPFYCVSIALRIKHRIEHAVIYDPLRQECFSASRGRGARLNDRRLRVSKKTQFNEALLGCGYQSIIKAHDCSDSAEPIANQCAGIRKIGSSALNLAYVASGRLDGFWDVGLNQWDIAAGSLLVQEAGGLVSDTRGGEDYLRQGEIIAATPKIFKSLVQRLAPRQQ